MTTLIERLKARAAQQAALEAQLEAAKPTAPNPTPVEEAVRTTVMDRIRAYAKSEAQIHARIFGVAPARRNPYNSLALFDGNAPTDATTIAGLMVAAFGYEQASRICADRIDDALYEDTGENHAWEMAQEVIEQMLKEINAQNKKARIQLPSEEADELAPEPEIESPAELEDKQAHGVQESFALNIPLNEKQLAAKDMAFAGKSFCLIGPAGSGKTTAQRSIAAALYDSGKLTTTSFKAIGGGDFTAPSIGFVAFTRRAAGNLRKAIHKDPRLEQVFAGNIMTIHQLLEFAPEYYWDSLENKQKFRFAPRRNAQNPLTITHLVIEEASMVGAHDLWQMLYDALPEGVQIIFIGDINQLPPVFGPSVLNYALVQLPIVELTETYRNQGSVLENAHRILAGINPVEDEQCVIIRGNKPVQLPQDTMGNRHIPKLLEAMYDQIGEDGMRMYDPDHDIVLSPFNKQAMGTTNINAWIAQFLGDRHKAVVYEILAGFNKVYLALGDKVMVNKRDGIVKEIKRNPGYMGREPQLPGNDLSRFGIRIMDRGNNFDLDSLDADDIDYSNFSLEALENQDAERKQQASHIVTIEYEAGFTEELSGAGDFGDAVFSLGWCLTGHKAQGSEWRKVFILMHKDHSTMLFREWLYTVWTRARIGVTVIAKDYLIEKAVKNPRILGNTLKDKLAYFNSGINNVVDVSCTK